MKTVNYDGVEVEWTDEEYARLQEIRRSPTHAETKRDRIGLIWSLHYCGLSDNDIGRLVGLSGSRINNIIGGEA